MAIHQPRLHLLSYDIADPQRLARVHRTVRAYGLPLQYSVFIIPGTNPTVDTLLAELTDIIEPTEDDIRVYPLPKQPDIEHFGRQWLADGVSLLGT
ncbi:CRISPR-associated endonuclease Cas2, partial [uncultured Thiohalocapsa sp.]|uniref:CRISPR-associated endonuclease Cas2 n=1 Tax=uncultured Thiohalocapsa sp. TaxID=768990 RepID=UPI0025F9F0B5